MQQKVSVSMNILTNVKTVVKIAVYVYAYKNSDGGYNTNDHQTIATDDKADVIEYLKNECAKNDSTFLKIIDKRVEKREYILPVWIDETMNYTIK